MGVVRRYPVVVFGVLAFVLAWGFLPFRSFGAFAPLVAALIVVPLSQGRAGLRAFGARFVRWRVRWYWYAAALGVPLGVHLVSALLAAPSEGFGPIGFASVGAFLVAFAVRLVNPLDGPLGEEPGWRGYALPALQARRTPLAATAVLAVVVTAWHVPLLFLEPGGLAPSFVVYFVVTTVAVTFWYTWLFDHARGSILIVVVAHSVEGSIQGSGLIYTGVWLAVVVALLVADRAFWRGPAPAEATTPEPSPPDRAEPAAPA